MTFFAKVHVLHPALSAHNYCWLADSSPQPSLSSTLQRTLFLSRPTAPRSAFPACATRRLGVMQIALERIAHKVFLDHSWQPPRSTSPTYAMR